MRKISVWICLLCFLAGCAGQPEKAQTAHPVVTGIRITLEEKGQQEDLLFDTDSQTSPVLNYIRAVRLGAPAAVNPEHVAGAMYTFTLELSDGSRRTLRQKGSRYFMAGDGIWYHMESRSEAKLDGVLTFCSRE